jgi:uncharacterized protein (DUF2225 family)
MKRRTLRSFAALVVCLIVGVSTIAITIFERPVECPVCKTINQFYDYSSWGSYVYQAPSKFQMVYWPLTDRVSLYTCKKCHLTLFMWDFKNLPKEKIPDMQAALAGVTLPEPKKDYTDVSMSDRLPVAEKLYKSLGEDQSFWALFYRVEGYHFDLENHADQALQARKHALEITTAMLADAKNAANKKELLVTSAAMHHFLNDDARALQELDDASKLAWVDEKLGAEKSKNYDSYLTGLITEYTNAIHAGKVPKDNL